MKKLLSLLWVLCVAVLPALSLAEAQTEIIVFAAASMTETLTEIKALYEAAHPGIVLTYNFDSSGTLKTQIQEGADCDLLERLAGDPAFGMTMEHLQTVLDPKLYIGRCPEQVDEFLRDYIQPIFDREGDVQVDAQVNV